MLATMGRARLRMRPSPWLLFAVAVGVGVGVIPASGFNLEPSSAQIFSDPTRGMSYWGRETYFGFSIAIQRNLADDSNWLVVGAPRANSSIYNPTRIAEPGAIFKCDLSNDQRPCQELTIDNTGNNMPSVGPNYHDYKNEGWLGGALDSQANSKDGRQATGTCAPRWVNQAYPSTYLMNGACYWLNSSLPDAPAHKRLPLIDYDKQTYTLSGVSVYYYHYGQAGLSIHFPDDHTEMIVGAPGVFNWQGTVIRFKDGDLFAPTNIATRRRRQVLYPTKPESQMFSSRMVPNPYHTAKIHDFDLNGYSVTSGRFFKKDELLYASGSPRGASSLGKAYIFSFPDREAAELNIRAEWHGTQLGEYFGASMVAADVNGDGFSDLVVGSPTYSKPKMPDMGRIQTFLSRAKYGTMAQSNSYFGSNSPLARFGTTLATPGDLNHDGYEDIAAGAPWENDGKGAVYIYMGSELGLRQIYAQRLSPEDFPSFNLGGFGMAISRGIDIDNNEYPDLAIGSFMSGHALVLRSRTVASLKARVTATPSTLLLEDTFLTLEACLTYDGHRVPRQVSIHGSVILDYSYPSPRASFRDTGLMSRDFNIMGIKGKSQCFPYQVDITRDKVDARRPILVRIEYGIPEASGQLLNQPKTDPGEGRSTTFPVSIVTGCEGNDDPVCQIDMHVTASFVGYSSYDKLVIGEDVKPVLKVRVDNIGESVFLPNVTINVSEPFSLLMPASHSCDYPIKDSRSTIVCRLANPIAQDRMDEVRIAIDASEATDTSNKMDVNIKVAGEGVELQPADNFRSQKLELMAKSELKLHGFSRNEQIAYQKIDEDKINTTLVESSFTHHYTLLKSGPTPLGKVEVVIDIPVNFTDEEVPENFITIYAPQTNFLDQPFICSIEGTDYAVEKKENGNKGNDAAVTFGIGDDLGVLATKLNEELARVIPEGSAAHSDVKADEALLHEVQKFSCVNNGRRQQISCARMWCAIEFWPAGSQSATLSFRMDVNFTVLASRISARGGATVGTTATATILSLDPILAFTGVKETTKTTVTQFLPDTLPARGVAWWIILLAILGGLLLLTAVAYVLYKMGFFKRKEQEEMKAQKAHVESNNQNGAYD